MVKGGGEGGMGREGGEGEQSRAIIQANTSVNLKRPNPLGRSVGSKVSRRELVGALPCTSKPECSSLSMGAYTTG